MVQCMLCTANYCSPPTLTSWVAGVDNDHHLGGMRAAQLLLQPGHVRMQAVRITGAQNHLQATDRQQDTFQAESVKQTLGARPWYHEHCCMLLARAVCDLLLQSCLQAAGHTSTG